MIKSSILVVFLCIVLSGCGGEMTIEQINKAKAYCESNDTQVYKKTFNGLVIRVWCKDGEDAYYPVPDSVMK